MKKIIIWCYSQYYNTLMFDSVDEAFKAFSELNTDITNKGVFTYKLTM